MPKINKERFLAKCPACGYCFLSSSVEARISCAYCNKKSAQSKVIQKAFYAKDFRGLKVLFNLKMKK